MSEKQSRNSEITKQSGNDNFRALEYWLKDEKNLEVDDIYEIVVSSSLKELESKLSILFSGNTETNILNSSKYDTLMLAINQEKKVRKETNRSVAIILGLALFVTGGFLYGIDKYVKSITPQQAPPICNPVEK